MDPTPVNRGRENEVVVNNHAIRLALPGLFVAMIVAGCQFAPAEAPNRTTPGQAAPGASDSRAPVQPAPTSSLAVSAADGSLLKADGGLFRSADQGQTWQRLSLSAALRPDNIRQVATSAAAPSSLYAAGPGAGVIRSDDDGQTWRAISMGLPSQEVAAFAVHIFRPDTLYTWIAGQGVFRTEDGGGRWEKMDDGPPAQVMALAHSTLEGSMNTGWLYAATPGGPYLSMD